jgi:hypothetical protein
MRRVLRREKEKEREEEEEREEERDGDGCIARLMDIEIFVNKYT